MPVNVSWDEFPDILSVDFDGQWTEEEYTAAVETANSLVREASRPVTVLLDMTKGTVEPRGNPFSEGKQTLGAMPEDVKRLCIIGGSAFTRAIMSTFFKIYRRPGMDVMLFATRADALRRMQAIQLEHS
jgi:hypothetical protein